MIVADYNNQDAANQIKSLSSHDSDSDNSEQRGLIDEDVVSSDSYKSVTEYLVSDQSSIIRAGSFTPMCKQSTPQEEQENSSFSNSDALSEAICFSSKEGSQIGGATLGKPSSPSKFGGATKLKSLIT